MDPVTFLESVWIAAYAEAFGRIKLEASYGSSMSDADVGQRAADLADAACANIPGSSVNGIRVAIAALK